VVTLARRHDAPWATRWDWTLQYSSTDIVQVRLSFSCCLWATLKIVGYRAICVTITDNREQNNNEKMLNIRFVCSFFHYNLHSVARQCLHCCKIDQPILWRYCSNFFFWGGGSECQNPWTDRQKIWRGWLRQRWLTTCQYSRQTPHWGRGGVCVKHHPRVVFSARCNIYISRLYYEYVSVRLSVRLSVTEVHWCIIANLGFKFRSKFTIRWTTETEVYCMSESTNM